MIQFIAWMQNKNEKEILRPPDYRHGVFQVFVYDTLDSTNTFLKLNHSTLPPYSVIRAKAQTNGRGRFERSWLATPGRDLCVSLLLPMEDFTLATPQTTPDKRNTQNTQNTQNIQNMPQLIALAVCHILKARGLHPLIKWPNDVLVSGRKICGILCETVGSGSGVGTGHVIAGVGLNINTAASVISAIDQPATSILQATGRETDPAEILEELLDAFWHYMTIFKKRGFAGIYAPFSELMAVRNKKVRLITPQKHHTGTITGINPDGALLFHCEKCGLLTVYSGEIFDMVQKRHFKGNSCGRLSTASPSIIR